MPAEVVDSGHSVRDVLNSNDLDVNVIGKDVVKEEIKVEYKTENDFNIRLRREFLDHHSVYFANFLCKIRHKEIVW